MILADLKSCISAQDYSIEGIHSSSGSEWLWAGAPVGGRFSGVARPNSGSAQRPTAPSRTILLLLGSADDIPSHWVYVRAVHVCQNGNLLKQKIMQWKNVVPIISWSRHTNIVTLPKSGQRHTGLMNDARLCRPPLSHGRVDDDRLQMCGTSKHVA